MVLALEGRRCLVVGGGPVAEGRVAALLAAGARVTVVSPTLTAALEDEARAGRIRHLARAYAAGDLAGHRLAIVATGRRDVDAQVAGDARAVGVWVNVADDPALCDFFLPSVLRRGRLVVAVSTGGASPALTRAVRRELEALVPAEYARLVEAVAEVRSELRARGAPATGAAWQAALDGRLRTLAASADPGRVRTDLLDALGVRP
jgi:siroheme synthase-like protein